MGFLTLCMTSDQLEEMFEGDFVIICIENISLHVDGRRAVNRVNYVCLASAATHPLGQGHNSKTSNLVNHVHTLLSSDACPNHKLLPILQAILKFCGLHHFIIKSFSKLSGMVKKSLKEKAVVL
jgi:hypothetical protein